MQNQLDASYASVLDGGQVGSFTPQPSYLCKSLRTYWIRGWRSPTADLDAEEKKILRCCKEHVLPARSPITTVPELSRLQVTLSQGIPSMKNAVCPISLFVANPCIFSKDLHKNLVLAWYVEMCCGGATRRRVGIRAERSWNRSVHPYISI